MEVRARYCDSCALPHSAEQPLVLAAGYAGERHADCWAFFFLEQVAENATAFGILLDPRQRDRGRQ